MSAVSLHINGEKFAGALRGRLGSLYFTDASIRPFDPLKYLTYFETRFPKELKLLYAVGIHPQFKGRIINPYTKQPETQSYSNIGLHSLAVAFCAMRIADALFAEGLISEEKLKWIVERALIHDLAKPYEIMRKAANRNFLDASYDAYEELKRLLVDIEMPKEVIEYLVTSGKETGHNSLKDFIQCNADGRFTGVVKGNLAEKVIHLADDMTFTTVQCNGSKPFTTFFTCWERMLASQFIERYPWMWTHGLGRTKDDSIISISDLSNPSPGVKVIGSYAELQARVADCIAQELQMSLKPSSKTPPQYYVKSLVTHAM